MRSPWLTAVLIVVALAAIGCAGEDQGASPEAKTWPEIAATLAPGLDADSDNVCTRGDTPCIDAVVGEMTRRLERLAATCDHDAAFAFMYREVTARVAEADAGFFASRASLNHLDAIFASLYFVAIDAWSAGRTSDVPEAWRLAFQAAGDRRVIGIGDMLLGMNAHISRDLPFALAAIQEAGGLVEKADFDRVSELLQGVQGPMLAEAARRFDPTIDDFSLPVLDVDDATVGQMLAAWREDAWLNAERLRLASTPATRANVEAAIEARAALRARAIRAATSFIPFFTSTKSRDDWCRRQREPKQ